MTTKLAGVIATVFVIAAGVVTWQQRQASTERSAREAALFAELREKTEALAEKDAQIANLQREIDGRGNDAGGEWLKNAKPSKPSAAVTPGSSPSGTAGPESVAELFRRTMDDPRTRDVRYQRIWTETKQIYGDFARSRRLSSEETDAFLSLIFGREAEEMEDSANFFSADKNAPGPSGKDPQAIAAERKAIDQGLQNTLGDGGYAAFQEYEKSVPDRDRLFEIRRELAIDTQPLSDDQANFLLQALLEERAKSPPVAFDPGGAASTREKYQIAVQGDNAANYLEVQTDLDKRFLLRAQPILSPEQYSALEGLQQQNIEWQKAGIEVARKVIQQNNNAPSPRP